MKNSQLAKPETSSIISCLNLFSKILEKVSTTTRNFFFQAILLLLQNSAEVSLHFFGLFLSNHF